MDLNSYGTTPVRKVQNPLSINTSEDVVAFVEFTLELEDKKIAIAAKIVPSIFLYFFLQNNI